MTEKLGVNEKEPAFGQKTPPTTTTPTCDILGVPEGLEGYFLVLVWSEWKYSTLSILSPKAQKSD